MLDVRTSGSDCLSLEPGLHELESLLDRITQRGERKPKTEDNSGREERTRHIQRVALEAQVLQNGPGLRLMRGEWSACFHLAAYFRSSFYPSMKPTQAR